MIVDRDKLREWEKSCDKIASRCVRSVGSTGEDDVAMQQAADEASALATEIHLAWLESVGVEA